MNTEAKIINQAATLIIEVRDSVTKGQITDKSKVLSDNLQKLHQSFNKATLSQKRFKDDAASLEADRKKYELLLQCGILSADVDELVSKAMEKGGDAELKKIKRSASSIKRIMNGESDKTHWYALGLVAAFLIGRSL